MNRNNLELNNHLQNGGLKTQSFKIYCGNKDRPPIGRVRGRPNQCFNVGRRSGFAAGIQEGLKQGVSKAKITRSINERTRRTVAEELRLLRSNVYITKEQLIDDFNGGQNLHQRPLQAIAKKVGLPRATASMADLLPRLMAHNWTRVNARETLLNL